MASLEIIAVSDNRNEWGHYGIILTDGGGHYIEASSYTRRQLGKITIRPGRYSTAFMGLDWASVSMEAPVLLKEKQITAQPKKPRKKKEWVLYMYRIMRPEEEHTVWNESIAMLRTSARTHFGRLRGIVQHYQLFQLGKPDRYEIKPVQ